MARRLGKKRRNSVTLKRLTSIMMRLKRKNRWIHNFYWRLPARTETKSPRRRSAQAEVEVAHQAQLTMTKIAEKVNQRRKINLTRSGRPPQRNVIRRRRKTLLSVNQTRRRHSHGQSQESNHLSRRLRASLSSHCLRVEIATKTLALAWTYLASLAFNLLK